MIGSTKRQCSGISIPKVMMYRILSRLGAIMMLTVAITPASALGRTPAAVVVEITTGDSRAALAPCADVALHAGAIHVAKLVADWLLAPGITDKRIDAPANLHDLEDASVVLLLRSPQSCVTALGYREGQIPSQWPEPSALKQWRVDASGDIYFSGDQQTIVPSGEFATLSGGAGVTLHLYNHGWLQLYRGLCRPPEKFAYVNGSATVYFEGPGDAIRFKVSIPRAGSLILERTSGDMPWLSMRIGSQEKGLLSRGMKAFSGGDQALVELEYAGFGPAKVDVGFLFTPDVPVQCRTKIGREENGTIRARLELINLTGEAVSFLKPSAGTVEWLAGKEIVAAARPGQNPPKIFWLRVK
ncbi:MAG: hypothetical protein R8K50_06275 [Mariprofundus sp.]